MAEGSQLEIADVVILIAYFVIVFAFGIWASLLNRGSVGGYFLAGRSMHFVLVGASLFASNIGSGHFIGLGGSGAAGGLGIAAFELNAMFVLVILGWLFLPVYIASGVFTMPEYIQKRFGGQRIRVYLAVLALILSIFTKIAADLFAGAIFIEQSLGWDLYASVILLLAVAALFTITGGLTAVIWTDFVQTIIMLVGALYLMIVCFVEVWGYESIKFKFMRAAPSTTMHALEHYGNTTCGVPTPYAFNLIRPATDPDYPWPGIIFGATVSGVWYWCTDQVIVQRALASKNYSHAKGGCLMAAYLKFLPMWIIVLPGMVARILYTDEIACTDPDICYAVCQQRSGCTNIAYPTLVLRLMPTGARGLMMAVMLAALMSSLTSIFNSSSTVFTIDIWVRFRKNASDAELMVVGRVFVLVMVVIGIVWIPIVQNFSELFHYIQSVTSFLSPPICAVYVLAVFWERTNEQGAFWGLMIGLAVGLTRFIWESVYQRVTCGMNLPDPRPPIIKDVHYLHFGILLFGIVFISTALISLLTKPSKKKNLARLLFWNRFSTEERIDDSEGERHAQSTNSVEPVPVQNNEALDTADEGADNTNENKGTDNTNTSREVVNSEEINANNENTAANVPCWREAVNWICGIEKPFEISEEEKKLLLEKQTSLEEEPFWKKFCDVNALLLMTVSMFIWGFFAQQQFPY